MQQYFPYKSYYPHQEEFIAFVHSSVKAGENVVVESPTGSGKTVAVLAAILPIAKEEGKRVIYLSRTHEQMDRVIEELEKISREVEVGGISFKSRRNLCLNDLVVDNTRTTLEGMYVCNLLRKNNNCKFYENVKEGIRTEDLRNRILEKPMKARDILKLCSDFEACPYEIAKHAMKECDVIACSYLYIFDPYIRERFLKSLEISMEDAIIVLDEAHNLPKLGIELASYTLTEIGVLNAVREARDNDFRDEKNFLDLLLSFLEDYSAEEKRIDACDLLNHLEYGPDLKRAFDEMIEKGDSIRERKLEIGKRPTSSLYSTGNFLMQWLLCKDREDFAFFISEYKTQVGEKKTKLEIVSLDPRNITQDVFENAFCSISMSGTLTPMEPYCKLVGIKDHATRAFPSPFPKENIAVFADRSVSTLGSKRTPEMYKQIGEKVGRFSEIIPSNVLVFFPSYVVLNGVLDAGITTTKPLFIERSDTTSKENNSMIRRFKRCWNKGGAVLLGVQQGRNSEGQDFPGGEANGVIVVGIPYAQHTARVDAQIKYYETVFPGTWYHAGYRSYSIGEFYAYLLPAYRAMNQAAGRAHRRLSDKAAIIFLENRIASDSKVIINISPWIKEYMQVMNSSSLEKELKKFYNISHG
ncbi:MAG: helicase C-terminal domain-containing protein [Candidatus Hydrothermarchaeales archaeon]